MPEGTVWNERIGVTRTIRENILLYLSAEGEVREDNLRKAIRITRKNAGQHIRFLEDHEFIEREYVDMGSASEFRLTDKGDELVGDIR